MSYEHHHHGKGETFLEETWELLTHPPHVTQEVVFEILSYSTKGLVSFLISYFILRKLFNWKSRYEKLKERVERLEENQGVA